MPSALVSSLRQWTRKAIAAFVFALMVSGWASAQQAQPPQPDPAGIATGDKSAVSDAAGNPLIVPNPPTRPLRTTSKTRRRSTTTKRRPPGNPLL